MSEDDRREASVAAAARRLAEQSKEIAGAIMNACREEVSFCASVESRRLLAEIRRTIARHAVDLCEAVAAGTAVADQQLDGLIVLARRWAGTGVPPHDLVHAYHVGIRVLVDYLLAELRLDTSLRAGSDYDLVIGRAVRRVLELSGGVASVITRACANAEPASGHVQHASERDLRLILDENVNLERGRALASACGLPAASTYVCALVRERADGRHESEVGRPLIVKALEGRMETFSVVRHEGAWAVMIEAGSRTGPSQIAGAFRDAIDDLGTRRPAALVVGVGRALEGVPGIRQSLRQARRAAALHEALPGADVVRCFEDVLPYAVLLGSRELIDEVVAASVGPLLAADRAGRDQLMEVLRAHLETGGRRHHTAKHLHMSPRTLDRRLARIRELTGRSTTGWSDLLMLGLGLFASELKTNEP